MGERFGVTPLRNGNGGNSLLGSPRSRLLGTSSPRTANKRPPVHTQTASFPLNGSLSSGLNGYSNLARVALLSEPLLRESSPPYVVPRGLSPTSSCNSPTNVSSLQPGTRVGSPPLAPIAALLKIVGPNGTEKQALGTPLSMPRMRSPRSPRDPPLVSSPRGALRSLGSGVSAGSGRGWGGTPVASPRALLADDGILSYAVKAAVEREAPDVPAEGSDDDLEEEEGVSEGTVEDFSRTLLEQLKSKDYESKDFSASRSLALMRKANSVDLSETPSQPAGPVVLPAAVSHAEPLACSYNGSTGLFSTIAAGASAKDSTTFTPRPMSMDGLGETQSNTVHSDKPTSPSAEKMRDSQKEKDAHPQQHASYLFWDSISASRVADRLNRKFGCFNCRCCHDRKTTGDNYAEVTKTPAAATQQEGGLPMDDENRALIQRTRNILHSELTPYMKQEELEELALQLQAAICNLLPMPFAHRIEIVIRAVPSRWASHVEETLRQLKMRYRNAEPKLKPSTQHRARTIELFWQGDVSQTGYLTQAQTKSLLRMLNMNIAKHVFESRFKQHDENMNGVLEFSDFSGFYDKLCEHAELEPIFCDIGGKGSSAEALDLDEFHEFLQNVQGEAEMRIARTRDIVAEWACLEYQGFSRYITSADNTWWNSHRSQVYQDMSHPLTSYYVFSSHNTYLSGDQITSESSVLMYKYALLRGCRCLEIDVWDGKEGFPIVTHGRTKTSSIYFKDVIETINENAFVKSKFPLVLSLEVHASLPQQVMMANMMRTVFGTKLTAPLTDPLAYTPSHYTPDYLKGKILLKGRDCTHPLGFLDSETEMSRTMSAATGQSQSTMSQQNSPQGEFHGFSESQSTHQASTPSKSTQHGRRVAPELAAVLYLKSIKLGNGSDVHATLQTVKPQNIMSLPEWKAERLMGAELAIISRKLLTRVYPKGTRVDSSNFDPQHQWSSGVQFAALNLQTPDYPVRLNQMKFEDNGCAGWLLKPDWLRSATKQSHETKDVFVLEVLVLSGGNLPHSRKNMDPFVEGFVCTLISPPSTTCTFKLPFLRAMYHFSGEIVCTCRYVTQPMLYNRNMMNITCPLLRRN